MKNILAVLLLAVALSVTAAEEPKKPDDFQGMATMCNGTYALCIKAPCDRKVDNEHVLCGCILENGWNMGPNSCDDRQKTLTSTYSNLFNLGSAPPRRRGRGVTALGARSTRTIPRRPSASVPRAPNPPWSW